MSKDYDVIDERMKAFVEAQHVMFVATAPSGDSGHVNVSPKGLAGTFAVLDGHRVAYLDLTGSGVETIAHLRENGRITVMFCAFDGPPRIVRLQGSGRVVLPADDDFVALAPCFTALAGTRSIIVVDVDRIADSCGYGVPLMSYEGDRHQLVHWAETKGTGGIAAYQSERNAASIDGLPGLVGPSAPID